MRCGSGSRVLQDAEEVTDDILVGRQLGHLVRPTALFLGRNRVDEREVETHHVRPPLRHDPRHWFVRLLVTFSFPLVAFVVKLLSLFYGFSPSPKREWSVLVSETDKPVLQFLDSIIDTVYERRRRKAAHRTDSAYCERG